jgi:hypothetical protein
MSEWGSSDVGGSAGKVIFQLNQGLKRLNVKWITEI